ncbi:hypothetical protein T265_14318, partial [Opisthorchis viverrini]
DQPCFGHRSDFGSAAVWNTYNQTRGDILTFGSALRSILPSRATVGLYGRNLPEWVYSQLACGYYGLITVPLYDTLGEEALHHILNQTEISLVVCDTFERAESILKQGSKYMSHLVVIKMDEADRKKLMKKAKDSVAIFTFAEMLVRGLGKEKDVPEPNPDDLFLVCYTSGSTGLPKGVMYTHRTFLKAVSVTARLYEFAEISVVGNVHVSFLPLAHIFEQLAMAACLLYGSQIAFLTTDFTRLLDDYAHYRPTVLALVPRVLSRMYAVVMEKVNASKMKARLFERAMKSKLEEQKRGIFKQCGILDSLCFRPIRNRVGGRVRVIVCASAPLQPEVFQFTKSAFSCPVIEAYGSTESGGLITMTLPTDVTGGHAGSIALDMKIKLIDVPSMGLTVKRDGIGESSWMGIPRRATSMARDIVRQGPVALSMAIVHPSYCLQCIAPFPNPPLDSPLTVLDLCTNLPARACNAELPTPPQIIGERNCGSYNHCTTSTRFLQLTMVMMMMMANGICVISPANTPGYYKESEKTKELFDEDGFIRMGDIGRWTACGTLQIVDRCKNIFKLSQGEYVAPEKVEQVYALSPLVLNVYVDGNSLYSHTVAVVVPNFEKLQKQFPEFFDELLKENNGIGSDSKKLFAEACRKKKLAKLILNELNKLGAEKGLKGFEQANCKASDAEIFRRPDPGTV